MAFGELEDLQGTTELIFFPSIWKECQSTAVQDRVYIVKGKVRIDGGDRAKIIVDSITNNLTLAQPSGSEVPLPKPQATVDSDPVVEPEFGEPPDFYDEPAAEVYELETDDMPPPPPNFEPVEEEWLPAPESFPGEQGQESSSQPISDQEPVAVKEKMTSLVKTEVASIDGGTSLVNSLLSDPSLSSRRPLGRTIVVDVRATGDWKKTCRKLVKLSEEYTGQDSLRIRIAEQALVMDFPNQKTHLCADLMNALEQVPAVCGVEVA
jgi:hypothetical protein